MSELSWVAAGCVAGSTPAVAGSMPAVAGSMPGVAGSTPPVGWMPASVWMPSGMPATAASVLNGAGLSVEELDERDWWWRTVVPADLPAGSFLVFDGIATLAEIWIDAELVHRIGGMFESLTLPASAGSTVSIRVLSLTVALAEKRPRPRWKARLVAEQRLRWFRTSLTGRMPGLLDGHPAVGPWRGVRLLRGGTPTVMAPGVSASLLSDGSGVVTVRSQVVGVSASADVELVVGDERAPAEVSVDGSGLGVVSASLVFPEPPLWWPHTHGSPALVPVSLEVDGVSLSLGSTGFRVLAAIDEVVIDINGCRVFARGACWSPLAADGTHLTVAAATKSLELLVAAGLNMVRFQGTTAWASPDLLAVCDRLGIMVWQDIPMAAMDYPDSAEFASQLTAEVSAALGAAAGNPSLVVVCGGAEVEQQAAMIGLPVEIDAVPFSAALAAALPPTVCYVANSPTGGVPAFRVDTGVAQYFGVGAYRRPIEDIRRASVRFAAECFAFAVPPHDLTAAGLTPEEWTASVPRDRGADWDFSDVTAHYAREFFGPSADASPEYLRDLHSAAAARCLTALWSEWRRPGSTCSGALAISLRDVVAGSGWGLLDAAGRPKSTWYAARRAAAPLALLHTDEGLNGLALHVVNDAADSFQGSVTLNLYSGERILDTGTVALEVPARGGVTLGDVEILGVFRDVTQAYHFGPASSDVAAGVLRDQAGVEVSRTFYVPAGALDRRSDIGLQVSIVGEIVTVSAARHARGVVVSLDHGMVDDAWFDLLPGESRELHVTGGRPTVVTVRALNAQP